MAVQDYDLSDIITMLRALIGEPLGSRTGGSPALRFKNTLLTTWFNWCQEEVALETRWKLERTLDTITADTTVYTLPSTCKVLILVEYKDSGDVWQPLQEVNAREFSVVEQDYTAQDEPVYMAYGDSIVVLPAWATSKNDGLRLTYIPRPAALASLTNTCSLRGQAVMASVWKVVEFAKYQDEKSQMAQIARAEYDAALAKAHDQASELRTQRLHTTQDVLFDANWPHRKTLGRK